MSTATPLSFDRNSTLGSLIHRCLKLCGYRDELIRDDAPLPVKVQSLVAFAHRPLDTRSACIAILPTGNSPDDQVAACRDIGAPLFLTVGDSEWHFWKQTTSAPRHLRSVPTREVENYFQRHHEEFAPGTIFRAKSWLRAGVGKQLDFVDAGLLPVLEREAGGRLLDLFERMVNVTMNSVGWDEVPTKDDDAHWLTKSNFWLLAAKLLQDKRVPKFIQLDLQDIEKVFAHVGNHYNRQNPDTPRINGRLRALRNAAREATASSHFRTISAETLGMLYEQALISPTTRKLLGTHRTPTYLVDYMIARLSGWIEELGPKRCHVFEPACGHAPFLSGALRLLSDMLPASIADNPKQRHDFIRDHLRGCDRDSFALEIARLSLTLADIPNENGWVLQPGDMFSDGSLAKETRAATLVLANPPFENEQAATFFKTTVAALQPGTIFGFVLPVNELTGSACEAVRRKLLKECEIKEISVFPDGMFKFASVETGIVLGRKHEARRTVVPSGILFRRIREAKRDAFRERYDDSWRETIDAAWLAASNAARFVVPDLRQIWEACAQLTHLTRLSTVAHVTKGFDFRSEDDPDYPKGQVTDSDVHRPGFVQGFKNLRGNPETHLEPELTWLNPNPRITKAIRGGTTEGIPQVLQAYSPTDRDEWRHKAFLDPVGRRATSRFLIIRPRATTLSLECVWALLNSPFANAYTFARTTKRDITIGAMRSLPVPILTPAGVRQIEPAVHAYLKAARDFTKKLQRHSTKTKPSRRKRKNEKSPAGQMGLGFDSDLHEEEIAAAQEYLRAMHWRVDAEVLRLYALPPELERQLLDAFDDVPRVGVPFEQTRYIPREFRDVLTLDEFLRITDEWDATEARRCELIVKRTKGGGRTRDDENEFKQLQRLLTLRRRFCSPLPTEEIKALTKELRERPELENVA